MMETNKKQVEELNDIDASIIEEMREQLGALKLKLQDQDIVNDRLLRQTFRQKFSYGKNYGNIALFLIVPFVTFSFTSMHYTIGFSWLFIAFTILMVLASAYNDYRLTRGSNYLFEGDMLTTAKRLAEVNRQMKLSYKIEMTVLAGWLVWLFTEFYFINPAMGNPLSVGMVVGAIIGVCLGYRIYKKILRNNQDIIEQINDLTK